MSLKQNISNQSQEVKYICTYDVIIASNQSQEFKYICTYDVIIAFGDGIEVQAREHQPVVPNSFSVGRVLLLLPSTKTVQISEGKQ